MDNARPRCADPGCTNLARRRGLCDTHAYSGDVIAPADQLLSDRNFLKATSELATLKSKYKVALKDNERLERERDASLGLQVVEPCVITPLHGDSTSEATVVVALSDWHSEEEVRPQTVSGLNKFNLDICTERVTTLWQKIVRLTRLLQQDVTIDTAVIGLLGDFVSGDIHEEISEVCLLPPMEAIVFVQNQIIAGIDFLLNNTRLKLRFVCHSGNHGRVTKTTRFAMENGHSIEYLMYRHLAGYYRNEPRVTFEIAEGYHSYLNIYGQVVRMHHGHAMKSAGGRGGIYPPVLNAIADWNKARRADIDIFGHFHTQADGGAFLANGSLIGYNTYALSNRFSFDVPKQTMFVLDKKRGRTFTMPVLFKR